MDSRKESRRCSRWSSTEEVDVTYMNRGHPRRRPRFCDWLSGRNSPHPKIVNEPEQRHVVDRAARCFLPIVRRLPSSYGGQDQTRPLWADKCPFLQHRCCPCKVQPTKVRPASVTKLTHFCRTARNSKPLEVIGTYDPVPKKTSYDTSGKLHKDIQLDIDRAKYWIGVGAQPSDPVWRFLSMVCLPHNVRCLKGVISRT